MVTHIHLSHAGVAVDLMQQFPNAFLVVHTHGARHMIDPEKLIVGTIEVYREEKTRKHYITIIPVLEDRVLLAEDKSPIDFMEAPSFLSLQQGMPSITTASLTNAQTIPFQVIILNLLQRI